MAAMLDRILHQVDDRTFERAPIAPDLDALIVNFPVLANKVLIQLAGIMAGRLRMLMDGEILLREPDEQNEAKP